MGSALAQARFMVGERRPQHKKNFLVEIAANLAKTKADQNFQLVQNSLMYLPHMQNILIFAKCMC